MTTRPHRLAAALLLLGSAAAAICDSCYRVAKVTIVFQGEGARIGYVPMLSGWGLGDLTPGKKNLAPAIVRATKTLQFFKTYAKVPRLGTVVAAEDLKTWKTKTLTSLVVMAVVDDFPGAGALPSLSRRLLARLKSSTVAWVHEWSNQDVNVSFICLNPKAREADLTALTGLYAGGPNDEPKPFAWALNALASPERLDNVTLTEDPAGAPAGASARIKAALSLLAKARTANDADREKLGSVKAGALAGAYAKVVAGLGARDRFLRALAGLFVTGDRHWLEAVAANPKALAKAYAPGGATVGDTEDDRFALAKRAVERAGPALALDDRAMAPWLAACDVIAWRN